MVSEKQTMCVISNNLNNAKALAYMFSILVGREIHKPYFHCQE